MQGLIKKIAIGMAVVISMGLEPPQSVAQDDSCYMINSAGQRVSLGKLCNSQSGEKNLFLAQIKRRQGGTPVIDVNLNGRSFEMLLDTGASGTLITRSMAMALNIPVIGARRFTMADGRTVVMPVGRLNSISIDGATVTNVNVAIANDSAEGLLGTDFLGNYDIKIKQTVVEFYPR
jgi:aspartyl protease family protein